MKAGKWVLYVVAGIVILLIIALGVFLLAGNSLIRAGIKSGASAAMKVPVDINNVDFKPFKGSIALGGLKIGNPEGYKLPTMLEMGSMGSAVEFRSLFSDTIVLDYVKLDNIHLTIEQKGLTTNLQEILNNLPKSEAEAQAKKPGKNIQIKTLELSNVSVTLKMLPLPGKTGTVTIKLDPIKMENLGTDKPMSMASLTSKILVALASGVAKQAGDLLPGDIGGKLKETIGGAGTMLKGAGQGATDIGKSVGEGIKGIFKKKN